MVKVLGFHLKTTNWQWEELAKTEYLFINCFKKQNLWLGGGGELEKLTWLSQAVTSLRQRDVETTLIRISIGWGGLTCTSSITISSPAPHATAPIHTQPNHTILNFHIHFNWINTQLHKLHVKNTNFNCNDPTKKSKNIEIYLGKSNQKNGTFAGDDSRGFGWSWRHGWLFSFFSKFTDSDCSLGFEN